MLSAEIFPSGKVSPYLVWLCSENKQFRFMMEVVESNHSVLVAGWWSQRMVPYWTFHFSPSCWQVRWLYPDQFWIIKVHVAELEYHLDSFVHKSFGEERGSWQKVGFQWVIGLLLHDGSRKGYVWNSENCLECLTYFKPSMISGYVKCPSSLGSANILYIF